MKLIRGKKNRKTLILVFLLLCLIFQTISLSVGQNAEQIQSVWNTNTSDWDNTRKVDGQLISSLDELYFRLYVKNSFSSIWIGIVIKNVTGDSTLSICIDANNDDQWPEDLKQITSNNIQMDGYWEYNNMDYASDPNDLKNFGGEKSTLYKYLAGQKVPSVFFSFRIPLTSSDKLYDLQIPEPEGTTIGIGLYYEKSDEPPFYWPALNSITDAAHYAKLTLAGPGAVAPPDVVLEPPGVEEPGFTTTTATTTEATTTTMMTTEETTAEEKEGDGGADGFSFPIAIGAIGIIVFLIKRRKKD